MTRHEPSTETSRLIIAGDLAVMPSAVSYLSQFPQSSCEAYHCLPPTEVVKPESLEPRLPAAHMYSA